MYKTWLYSVQCTQWAFQLFETLLFGWLQLGQRGVPWAAVVDGTFIKDLPRYLRGNGSFRTKIRLLGGLTYDAGGIYVTDVPGVKARSTYTYLFS